MYEEPWACCSDCTPTAMRRRRRSAPCIRSAQLAAFSLLRSASIANWISSMYSKASKPFVGVEKRRAAADLASSWRLQHDVSAGYSVRERHTCPFQTSHRGDSSKAGEATTIILGAINCNPTGMRYAEDVLLVDEAKTTPDVSMTPRIWMFWYRLTAKPRAAPVDVSDR